MFMRTQISGKKSRMGKFYKKGRNRIYEVCKEKWCNKNNGANYNFSTYTSAFQELLRLKYGLDIIPSNET